MQGFPKNICLALLLFVPWAPSAANGLEDFKFAKVLLSEGEWAAAMNFFGLAIDDGALDSGQLAVAHHLRGVSRGKLNKHRLALRDHKKAVGLDPDYVSAWSSICYQHTAVTKQLEDAMAACNHALRLDPKHAPSYALRAEVWHGQGQPDQAEQDFAHSLQLAPTIWGVYFNRGLFYHDTKRPGKAKQDFIKAHNLAPAWEQRKMATAPIFQGYGIAP